MNKAGPIIVIEDDADDQEMLDHIFKKLNYKNEIIFFSESEQALEYLITTNKKPFLILSDINMPKLNGFELRDKIQTIGKLELECTPYLFLTTAASQKIVIEAYSKSVQGFFVKPVSYDDLERSIKRILEYWQECIAPYYIKASRALA